MTLYVAIEGVKGVGKGTLISNLKTQLQKEEIKFLELNPTQPLTNHFIEKVDQLLPLRRFDVWRKYLYAVRSQMSSRHVRRELSKSDSTYNLILGDRSILTSLVTRWPDEPTRDRIETHFENVRKLESEIPIPDVIIYLEADLDAILERISNRRRDYGQEDEEKSKIIDTMKAYDFLKNNNIKPFQQIRWHSINASGSPDSVCRSALSLILSELK